MKFSIHLYPFYVFPDLPAMVKYVQRAEQAGYSVVNIPEHIIFPTEHNRTMGQVWWDPIVLATHLADATKTIRLAYSVLILPQHNPIYLAKQIATLDCVSGGRINFGVGVGWLKEEFDMLGADFHKRGRVMDEYIQAIKALWTTDPSEFRGEFVSFSDASFHPKPLQKPHPPVHIGGGARASARRAAALGDGWIPMNPATMEEYQDALGMVKDERRRRGLSMQGFEVAYRLPLFDRSPGAIEHSLAAGGKVITSFKGDHGRAIEHIRNCESMGVTLLQVDMPYDYPRTLREMESFAERVIHRL